MRCIALGLDPVIIVDVADKTRLPVCSRCTCLVEAVLSGCTMDRNSGGSVQVLLLRLRPRIAWFSNCCDVGKPLRIARRVLCRPTWWI
ncbi:hypothetical protein PoB_006973900 [Plakobranchus ocellatus]|uniref:Secreted protein n=1 Tax=Plakobranchus ocellatus TaxID=259542 RepID=A0AAV4DG67_9GAST|nr:hypothetical protein PoB_006973900 [Plakobranchus ocellatus]